MNNIISKPVSQVVESAISTEESQDVSQVVDTCENVVDTDNTSEDDFVSSDELLAQYDDIPEVKPEELPNIFKGILDDSKVDEPAVAQPVNYWMSKADFIEQMNIKQALFKDRFTFTFNTPGEFLNETTLVKINCDKHGIEIKPANIAFQVRVTCTKCYAEYVKKHILSLGGGFFNLMFDRVFNGTSPMRIYCPIHGEFTLTVNNLLRRKDAKVCPHCKNFDWIHWFRMSSPSDAVQKVKKYFEGHQCLKHGGPLSASGFFLDSSIPLIKELNKEQPDNKLVPFLLPKESPVEVVKVVKPVDADNLPDIADINMDDLDFDGDGGDHGDHSEGSFESAEDIAKLKESLMEDNRRIKESSLALQSYEQVSKQVTQLSQVVATLREQVESLSKSQVCKCEYNVGQDSKSSVDFSSTGKNGWSFAVINISPADINTHRHDKRWISELARHLIATGKIENDTYYPGLVSSIFRYVKQCGVYSISIDIN